MKKPVLVGVAVVLLLAAVALVVRPGPSSSPEDAGDSQARASGASASGAASRGASRGASARGSPADAPRVEARPLREDPEIQQLLAHVRGRFPLERLKNAYAQVKLLEDLMRYFQQRYPERWEEALLEFLREAYPEVYEQLAGRLRGWLDYERWMKDNETYLQQLDPEERRKNVWAERERLFGKEAAEQIWASERRSQAVAQALGALDARADVGVTQKVKLYREQLQEVYGPQADAWLERHRQEAMNRFLDLSSVQQELSALPPEERSKNLREIRSGLGMDEEALGRWDSLDRERDARWDSGAKYMAEREALAQQYSGEALEARLRPVRERYFGGEAETIASEEAAGFLRFERPRVWGRN